MKNRILQLIAAMVLALSAQAAHIDTDRTWYLAGEAMKVNVSAVDNALIAYAELCDANGLAASAVVNLKQGNGACTIELPSSLHSGYYVLSVYSRNNDRVLNKLVAVVNTLHKSLDDDITWTKADSCYVTAKGAAELINKKNTDVRETEGQIIKARIKNVYGGKTYKADQIRASLSIIGKQIHYFEGKMENDSTAVFYTFGIHGKQPLVLSAVTSTDVGLPIEIISQFAALLPKQLPHLVFNYKRSEVEARSLDMQRHQIIIAPAKQELQLGVFTDEATEEAKPLEYSDNVFGTKPDLSYNLDEYRQFLTIKEVLIEYVNCVTKKRVKGTSKLFVRRELEPYNTILPSLILIDGMPVQDVERLLKYDARRIHYINIYGGQYTFGSTVFNGILSFVSRSGRLTNYPTEPNMQYLVYEF